MPRTKKPTERHDIGALVFVIALSNGTFGVKSTNGKVEAWGNTFDQAWGRYYKKAERLMKREKIGPYAEAAPEPAADFQEV